MDWHEQLFYYCERGTDSSVWAEPLNTFTNMMLLIVGGWLWILVRQQGLAPQRPWLHYVWVAFVFALAGGSILLHTRATQWALVLETAIILLFMGLYLFWALRLFLRINAKLAYSWTAVFIALTLLLAFVPCKLGYCAHSLVYIPALVATVITARLLQAKNHPAARWLWGAALLFVVALLARTLDRPLCDLTDIGQGYKIGWHYIWHLLISIVLFILVQAMIQFHRYVAVGKLS